MPQIFPDKGSFAEFYFKRAILQKIIITPEDEKFYEISRSEEDQALKWNAQKDIQYPLDVDFTEGEIKFIRQCCEKIVDAPNIDDFWIMVEKLYS